MTAPQKKPKSTRVRIGHAASLAVLMMLGFVLWFAGGDTRRDETPVVSGWGQAAADAAPGTHALHWLPMAAANACGLGASSCFKCHNGKRASAPASDATKSPWHAQHAKVNNSCTGCHKGNPRVMKDDVAHTKMIAKPRDDSGGSCAGCHSADLAKVKSAYAAGGK